MPLVIQPADESDAYRAALIERDAFSSSDFNSILFPGPFPPDVLKFRAEELLKQRRNDDTAVWVKVVDTDIEANGDNTQMVAFAKWNIYEHAPKPKPLRDWPPGVNADACNALFGPASILKDRWMGDQSYVFLHILVTDPAYQRKGAGTMLVNWGVDEAKKRGYPAYLESSDVAHGLYLKSGFRDLELLEIDLSKWGAKDLCRTWAMRRDKD